MSALSPADGGERSAPPERSLPVERSVPVDPPLREERPIALIKGAGDLATGVAIRLVRAGFAVVMTEVPRPTVVRRSVAFAEAVFEGEVTVEGITAVLVPDLPAAGDVLATEAVPVLVDPEAAVCHRLRPALVVDAIVAKRNLGTSITDAPAVVALGPGFVAGHDVHAVVETKRGHDLGRVITSGEALPNTGVPGVIDGHGEERVLRAPREGTFSAAHEIGYQVALGDVLGHVDGVPVPARIGGVLRGLLHSGLEVREGGKLGDVDPRGVREYCFTVSDKARAVAGGVLEAACLLLGGVRFAAPPAQSEAAPSHALPGPQRRENTCIDRDPKEVRK